MQTGPKQSAGQADTATGGGGKRSVDVAVIGGGAIGASVAAAIAAQRHSVLLIDPLPGSGASKGNAGLIVPSFSMPMSTPENLIAGLRSLGSRSSALTFARPVQVRTLAWLLAFVLQCRRRRVRRDAATLFELATRSHQMYWEMAAHDMNVEIRTAGWLWCYESKHAFGRAPDTAGELRRIGAVCEVLSGSEAAGVVTGLSRSVVGALWFPFESVIDPQRTTQALLQRAIHSGVNVLRERVVGAIRRQSRIEALMTTNRIVPIRHVVIAAGGESREVGRRMGVRVPVERGSGWSVTLGGDSARLPSALMSVARHVVISPLTDGIRVTGGMQFGGVSTSEPSLDQLRQLRIGAERLLPWSSGLEVVDMWRGARPMTTTGLPLVGQVGGADSNVFVATGHGPLGMTLAPITGELLASHLGKGFYGSKHLT